MKKVRVDLLLVERYGVKSRVKAKELIQAGKVYQGNEQITKASMMVLEDTELLITGMVHPYVSRGGQKIEKVIEKHQISLIGKRCMDIGASTGGFTDCMLMNGASYVYAVDVGTDQLDPKLKNDPRVSNMEKTNIREVNLEMIQSALDFISIDVSFISLKLVIPHAVNLLKESGEMVFLIKPQFEVGKEKIQKNGVVKDERYHVEVLKEIIQFVNHFNLEVLDLMYSPIKGPKGNIEFLCYAQKKSSVEEKNLWDYVQIVKEAHHNLSERGSFCIL